MENLFLTEHFYSPEDMESPGPKFHVPVLKEIFVKWKKKSVSSCSILGRFHCVYIYLIIYYPFNDRH